MAGEEREFKIKITGDASSLVGESRKSADALGQVEGKTKDSAAAHNEAEKATHRHAEGHKELHKAMHVVMEESPVLGLLLKTALSPTGGALLGAIFLFQKLNGEIEAVNKRLEEMEDTASKPIGNFKEAVREANEEVEKGQRAFTDWLEGLDKVAGQAKDQVDEEIQSLEQETQATQDLLKAKAELDKARIDEAVQGGGMTKAQGVLAKADIDTGLAYVVAGSEQDALQRKSNIQARALRDVSDQRLGIGGAIDELQGLANDPNRALRIQNAEKHLASLKEQAGGESEPQQAAALRDAQDRANQARSLYDKRTIDPITGRRVGAGPYVEGLKAQAEAEESRVANMVKAQQEMAKERDLISSLKTEQEEWNKKLEKAKTDYSSAAGVFDELSHALEATRSKLESVNRNTPQRLAVEDETRQTKAIGETPFGKLAAQDVTAAGETASAIGQHRNVSNQDKQKLVDVASAVAGYRVSLSQAVQMMQAASHNIGVFTRDVIRMANAMHGLAAGQSALTGKVNSIENQVHRLQHQMKTSYNEGT